MPAVTTNQLSISASRTGNLRALAWLKLNIVNNRPDWHCCQWHRIAWLHIRFFRSDNFVASLQTLWCQNVGLLTVIIFDKRDERRAVWIIFQTLNGTLDIKLATFEIDQTVCALVPTTFLVRCNASGVVTTTTFRQTLQSNA